MTKTSWTITALCVFALAIGTALVLQSEPPIDSDPHGHSHGAAESGHDDHADHADHASDAHAEEAGHDDHEHEMADTGPHGGRVLEVPGGSVEVTIFETDTPPEFRLYITNPDNATAAVRPEEWGIVLSRTDRVDSFTFRDGGEYLQSREPIAEPHEFTVSLRGVLNGRAFDTSYFQEEHHHASHGASASGPSLGLIRLDAKTLADNDVRFARAEAGLVATEIQLPGEIALNADRVAHIVPRFSGIALEVLKRLGDRVAAGDLLAIIQSNESVAPYEVKTQISGTIVERHITVGEYVRDDNDIFVVADLSTVWVHISIYPKYFARVKPGLRVRLRAAGVEETTEGVIDYVGPIVGERTRTAQARVVLNNSSGLWQPGLFVTAHLVAEEHAADLVVPDEAVQTVEGRTAVFVRRPDGVEARPVVLGRSDGRWAEVLAGLAAGEEIAVSNSFLLKAEFGKSEAGHDH